MLLAPLHETLDVQKVRAQFPALHQTVHGRPLVYLDNAATTQKPQAVLDALTYHYRHDNANVHRGEHMLASRATAALETVRQSVQQFIGAANVAEIIFTAGATAGINLVAATYGQANVQAGDEVVISHMEHHANIVPWQMLCQAKRAHLKIIPIDETGTLVLSALENILTPKTKIVAINHVSNTLGTINPIKEIILQAHAQGAIVVVDSAQAVPHLPIDVQDLDCDFLVFSAHKAYGPTGVGVLYGKKELLEDMPPYQGGGSMIQKVTLEHSVYSPPPYKFEAGTPGIADIVAWKESLHFIRQIGYKNLRTHENKLLICAFELLKKLKGIRIIGTASQKIGILSFVLEGIHALDIGTLLDAQGIAVRTGPSCTQPLMDFFGVEGVVRVSFAVYNTFEEIEKLVSSIARIAHHKT